MHWCITFYPDSTIGHFFQPPSFLLVKNINRISSSTFMNTLCQAQKVNLCDLTICHDLLSVSDNVTPTDGLKMQALFLSNHNLAALATKPFKMVHYSKYKEKSKKEIMNKYVELISLESGSADFLTLLEKMLLKIKFQQWQYI